LCGILLLLAGVAGFAWVTRPSQFPLGPRGQHPSVLHVQIPASREEFAGSIEFGNATDCPMIVRRLQANMAADSLFPIAYGLCLLAIVYFIAAPSLPGLPPQPKAARVFAGLTAVAIVATVLLDYRENAHTVPLLMNACQALPGADAIDAMRAASLCEWGALGAAVLLLGVTSALTRRTPAWFYTYTSIRVLAALSAGLFGIAVWFVEEPHLAEFEFAGLSVVVLATLWQALAALR
jgi:hypothetical protein